MEPSNPLCREHTLVLKKELSAEEVGREKIICAVCKDPVSGPSYKCKECKYIVHESCNVPPIQHTLHPESDHTLVLKKASTSDSCDACCKDCKSRTIYECKKCPFKLDIECASRWPQSNTNNVCQHMEFLPIMKRINFTCLRCKKESKDIAQLCRKCRLLAHVECAPIRDPKTNDCQHEFVLINERILFKCQVCRDERKDIAYLCSLCQLLVHNECAKVRRTITISKHKHSLTLTYSVISVRDFGDSKDVFCQLCSQRIEKAYAAYYCQSCTFVAHFECATMSGDFFMTSRVMETKQILGHTYLIEEINLSEIERADCRELKHVSHEHPLTRVSVNKELDQDDKLCVCDACTQFIISDSFYSCSKCNFNLHQKCARLPQKKQHPLHPHPLILFSQAPNSDSGIFVCEACKGLSHGFVYRCEHGNCSYNLDVRCCSLSGSLKHEGHPHILFPVKSLLKCNACDSETDSYGFVCIICQFYLGVNCATLPLSARHRYDTHVLQPAYTVEDDSGEYYCLICEEERNPTHWFYYCKECSFTAHPKCLLGNYPYIKFGKTYTDKDHRHPVTFVREPEDNWLPCNACGEHFNGLALECRTCKFCVHSRHDLLLKNSDCLQKKDSNCEGESR